jgi:PadR family transcriptional regulator PadR
LEIEGRSQGYFRFNHGTLYPILHKLEAAGLIQGAWQDPGSKRKRRQYSLTEDGSQRLDQLRGAWHEFSLNLFNVIGGVQP